MRHAILTPSQLMFIASGADEESIKKHISSYWLFSSREPIIIKIANTNLVGVYAAFETKPHKAGSGDVSFMKRLAFIIERDSPFYNISQIEKLITTCTKATKGHRHLLTLKILRGQFLQQ